MLLELNKVYDITYATRYEINYLNSIKITKITAKMYYLAYIDGTTFKIRQDSILESKMSTEQW